jgi:hypothetical protein
MAPFSRIQFPSLVGVPPEYGRNGPQGVLLALAADVDPGHGEDVKPVSVVVAAVGVALVAGIVWVLGPGAR